MVNKCSVYGCYTNFDGHERGTDFGLHTVKDPERKNTWFNFCNRSDLDPGSLSIFVCEKHFEPKYIKRNKERSRLVNSLFPVPTIHPNVYEDKPSCVPTTSQPRKQPKERVFQEDELQKYKTNFLIESFSDINESLLEYLEKGFTYSKYDDHVVFYKTVRNELSIPQVTDCIRIDSDLHVKLFYKGSPIPLPEWFRKSSDCKFASKDMLLNFSSHIRQESERLGDVLEELQQLRFKKSPVYSANLIRYALMLRYSSLSAYRLLSEEFRLPSPSLLRKITTGKIDAMKSAKILRENGNISEDVILMFDEMYLQKCEEYAGGETVGADEDGDLYKGIVCFMIVGLKSNVPYVIKALPEKKIEGKWVKEELLNCLKILQENGFNVRGVVCDDHSTNVSAYKQILTTYGQNPDDLFVTLNGKKIYLFFDTVHLIKNIRNNLLNRKRFLFPEFYFNGLYDEVKVTGGEITWRLFHEVHEKDKELGANMKAAPQLTAKVLHPGNCKQNVPVALAIFHESTSAAIKHYIPEKTDAAEFLNLFNVWWTISNSKQMNNSRHRLGNAAVPNDKKTQFLRALADWVDRWDNEKIPNCEKFNLTAQTSSALKRTLRCHAALIEDLLTVDDYKFVLTARFQSDPLERRYGQYRQMSGGRFLVSLKDVLCSEKILKVKSLVQEGFDIDDSMKITEDHTSGLELLERSVEHIINVNRICLSQDTREVSDHVAGYIAHKLLKLCKGCCEKRLVDENSTGGAYHQLLSRGGLKVPSLALSNYVASGFAILDACSDAIRRSDLPARKAGEHILRKVLFSEGFTCKDHDAVVCPHAIRIIANVFFNNQRKRSTEAVVNDRVVAFKKSKRTKSTE